jgi:hypothetical protein
MKRELRGKTFQSDQEVKTACSTILMKLAVNSLQHVYKKWMEHFQGRYFEKTPPPHLHNVLTQSNKVSP